MEIAAVTRQAWVRQRKPRIFLLSFDMQNLSNRTFRMIDRLDAKD
jgi:hypothetical protein